MAAVDHLWLFLLSHLLRNYWMDSNETCLLGSSQCLVVQAPNQILVGRHIKDCLAFPEFSCLTLRQNKFRFNNDTHLRVRPIPSLLKNNRMSPQHFSFHNTELCIGSEYERITNTLFLWTYHVCHVYVLQMRKICASLSQKWRNRTYLSHLWNICTHSPQVWQIRSNFSRFWQIRLTVTFERICHKCEEFARICHTCGKFERSFRRCDKYVRILHTSKIRHLWKTRTYQNFKVGRTYVSHIHVPKCDVFVQIIQALLEKYEVWLLRSFWFKTYLEVHLPK